MADRRPSDSRWDAALRLLSEDERRHLQFSRQERANILQKLVADVEQSRQRCIDKSWHFTTTSGNRVILRDVLDKITRWIEAFQKVGDVAVQYDPAHAALPWAGVRLLLRLVTSDSRAFGSMVQGIEVVTNAISRAAILEGLYADARSQAAQEVEQALTKLYVAILRFLCYARRFYCRDTVRRIASSLAQTTQETVDGYLAKVSTAKADLEACSRIADSTTQRDTNENITALRGDFDSFRVEHTRTLQFIQSQLIQPIQRSIANAPKGEDGLSENDRRDLMRWLSDMPYKAHHRAHSKQLLVNSCEWLLNTPEYSEWTNSSVSSIFWLHGPPGSGKTNVVASVIERLISDHDALSKIPHTKREDAPFTYFYCACGPAEPGRADPEEILRSILQQFACPDATRKSAGAIAKLYKRRLDIRAREGFDMAKMDIEECVQSLLLLARTNPMTIIIDALDECNPQRRYKLITSLERIVQGADNIVKVLVSSRRDGDLVKRLSKHQGLGMTERHTADDICKFVKHKITCCITEKRLLSGEISQEASDLVIRTLKEKAQGS